MSSLVERLRAPQEIEAHVTFEKLHALRHEAADRIEAQEAWDRKRAADLMTLGGLVGKLEAALQEIAGEWDTPHTVREIARKALEEEKL